MSIALIFPGQGSQHIGMAKYLYDNFSLARESFEEASDCLSQDMKTLCFEGPESDLVLTENTQPALLLSSVVTFRCLASEGPVAPKWVAGHSVGEYAALVCAEALSFAHALKAVKARGQAMQRAVPPDEGGMLAVLGGTDQFVVDLCDWVCGEVEGAVLEPANFNSPGQVVVSGHSKAIEFLRDNQKDIPLEGAPAKLRLIPLKVSAPFHCSLMQPAQDVMRDVLEEITFSKPRFPVVQNVVAEAVDNPEWLRLNLIQQVTGSVRWTASIQNLYQKNVKAFIECGAGSVLTGLGKKIVDDEGIRHLNTKALEDFKGSLEVLESSGSAH